MRNDLKDLVVAMRRAMPSWIDGAAISMTLTPSPPEGDIVITMNGVPPNDVVTVTYMDRPEQSFVIRNWGVAVVDHMMEPLEEK